jgi:hypothetical protein
MYIPGQFNTIFIFPWLTAINATTASETMSGSDTGSVRFITGKQKNVYTAYIYCYEVPFYAIQYCSFCVSCLLYCVYCGSLQYIVKRRRLGNCGYDRSILIWIYRTGCRPGYSIAGKEQGSAPVSMRNCINSMAGYVFIIESQVRKGCGRIVMIITYCQYRSATYKKHIGLSRI